MQEAILQFQPTKPQPALARWQPAAVEALFELPFTELLLRAQGVHREHFDPTEVQLSTLLSIKTGGCPEDCALLPAGGALRHRRRSRAS